MPGSTRDEENRHLIRGPNTSIFINIPFFIFKPNVFRRHFPFHEIKLGGKYSYEFDSSEMGVWTIGKSPRIKNK